METKRRMNSRRNGAVVPSLGASQRALHHIKQLILSGKAGTGATLNEEAISREIGLSRTPVREALQVLQAQGYVRIERYRGATVTGLETRDVHELFDLRLCLERHAITGALRPGRALDLSELRSAIDSLENALGLVDANHNWTASEIQADRAFHFGVLRLHGNSRLEAILETVWDQVVRCSHQIMQHQPFQNESLEEHRALLAALEHRALDRALVASETHLRNAMRRTLLSE